MRKMLISDFLSNRLKINSGLDHPQMTSFRTAHQEIDKLSDNEYLYKSCRTSFPNPMVKRKTTLNFRILSANNQ